MSTFTAGDIEYLRSQQLARLATVGPDGRPRIDGSSYEVSARDVTPAVV